MIYLKLDSECLRDKRIKKIRTLEHGDTYALIFLRMQLLAAENDGHILFEQIDDDFASEIALSLDEDVCMVSDTISILEKYGLIEVHSDTDYLIPGVSERIGRESDSALRVRKHRAKKASNDVDSEKMLHCNAKCNADVTGCNESVTVEKKEKEKEEKEKEKNQKKKKENKKQETKREIYPPLTPPSEPESNQDAVDCDEIVDAFNDICISLPHVQHITSERKRAARSIVNRYGMDSVMDVFRKVEGSEFLTGRKSDFAASFDWIMIPQNFVKILEGNYRNHGHPEPKKTGFSNFNQREYDFDNLERMLLTTGPAG